METESRLIYVNMLKAALRTAAGAKALGHSIPRLFCVDKIIDSLPTVDAVEVVRCGKCLYYSETTGKDSGKPCGYGVCTKPFHITNIVANEDFCSFGQRRVGAKMDGDGNG